MSFNSSWTPDESALDLFNERTNFVGAILESTGYGCLLVLYIFTARALFRRADRVAWWSLSYITLMFVLVTISNALDIKYNQMVFIDYRNYVGPDGSSGPVGFLTNYYNAPVEIAGLVLYFMAQWLQDGLLIYRFFTFFGSNYYIVIAPILLFIATIILDSLLLFQVAQPLANIWQGSSVVLAIPAYSISIGLNILLTIAICIRLMIQRNRMKGSGHSDIYFSLTAMLVESAALYSVIGVVFLITYGMGSFAQNIALALLSPAQAIAPTLIIYRVAERQAWDGKTQGSSSGPTRYAGGSSGPQQSAIQFGKRSGTEFSSTQGSQMEMKGRTLDIESGNGY